MKLKHPCFLEYGTGLLLLPLASLLSERKEKVTNTNVSLSQASETVIEKGRALVDLLLDR